MGEIMAGSDQNDGEIGVSRNRENYNALIALIEETLARLYGDKEQLVNDTREGLTISLNKFWDREEIEEAISKNEWVLREIAERNFQRHQKLVNLLKEKFELRRLVVTMPHSASGIKKNLKIEQKITNIDNQIESIIEHAEKTSA